MFSGALRAGDGTCLTGGLCNVLDGHRFIDERSPGGAADSASSHLISSDACKVQSSEREV